MGGTKLQWLVLLPPRQNVLHSKLLAHFWHTNSHVITQSQPIQQHNVLNCSVATCNICSTGGVRRVASKTTSSLQYIWDDIKSETTSGLQKFHYGCFTLAVFRLTKLSFKCGVAMPIENQNKILASSSSHSDHGLKMRFLLELWCSYSQHERMYAFQRGALIILCNNLEKLPVYNHVAMCLKRYVWTLWFTCCLLRVVQQQSQGLHLQHFLHCLSSAQNW